MLRRWLKAGVETPPPEQYLPEPCQTPEKDTDYEASNFEVLETLLLVHANESEGSIIITHLISNTKWQI